MIIATIIFIILISIITVLFVFIKLSNNDNELVNIEQPDTIYNDSPVLWERKNYESKTMKSNIDKSKPNIFIVENVGIYQKKLFNMLSDEYNLYFFNNGEDFLFFFENSLNNNTFAAGIIATDECQTINGITLFNLISNNDFFLKSKKVILTRNKYFLSKKNIPSILKPFDENTYTKLKKLL